MLSLVQQNLTTLSGATYTVAFWLGVDNGTSAGPNVKSVTFDLYDFSGGSAVLLSDSRGSGNDQYSLNGTTQGTAWSRFTFTVKATSALTAVYVTSLTAGSTGLTIDDVSIRQLYSKSLLRCHRSAKSWQCTPCYQGCVILVVDLGPGFASTTGHHRWQSFTR